MRTVWQQLLDRLAIGEMVVCADETRRWDKKQWQETLGLGLLRETELAESIICDQCGEGHWAGIHWEVPGVKACFGCDTEGVIDIEIDRLRQWRMDAGRAAGLTAGALDLPGTVEMLLPDRLWRLGRRRLGGRYREIFFGIGAGVPVSAMSTAIRSSIGAGSALLLTLGSKANPEGLPAGQHLLDLASVCHVENDRLVLDVDYIEDRLAESGVPARKSTASIPAAAGTTWRQVSIIVFESFMEITAGGTVREVAFSELGVEQASQPIELLKCFAAARGTLGAEKIKDLVAGASLPKARVLRLRQLLQPLIDIDGDPIEHNRKAASYSCQFEIRLAGDDGFRTPAGATWLDLTFHEREDGRIIVSVPEKRKFRAHGLNVDGRGTGEVAERSALTSRTYSLEEIGLRAESGRLTEEGHEFVTLLRASGTLARRGNDMTVLQLAKRLRAWTGLDGEPLRLIEATGSWSAVFACSSEVVQTTK